MATPIIAAQKLIEINDRIADMLLAHQRSRGHLPRRMIGLR
jgi:hypothetical protein